MKENKNNEFRSKVYTDRPTYADFEAPAKFEAIKEFAERLKTNFNKNIRLYGRCTVCDATTEIDDLVKEMTEV